MDDVLVTAKRTAFEHILANNTYDAVREQYEDDDLQQICEGHETHYNTLTAVERRLETNGLSYETVAADGVTAELYDDRDLIVSVGGDGTVLETAKYMDDATPLLPIRSDGKSRGGLCTYGKDDFNAGIDEVVADTARIEEWTRLEAHHGDETDVALNELFIGAADSTDAARYTVEHDDVHKPRTAPQQERQQSSGMVVATGAGSTGWYQNIADSAGPFGPERNHLRYAVREPMDSDDEPYRFATGSITLGDTFIVRSEMNGDKNGILRYDGDKEDRTYDFSRGSRVEIRIADSPLHVIS